MLLVSFSLGKSFVQNSECVKMWLTDEQNELTDTNIYKRRLSDGLFAIGRKRFLKILDSRHFNIKNHLTQMIESETEISDSHLDS